MGQQMKLAPRMIQANEILQMSAMALEERIEQELVSNPTLELREPGEGDEDLDDELKQEQRDSSEGERELTVRDDADDPGHKDDFERLGNMTEEYGEAWASNTYESESYRPARDTGERDAKMDAMANTAARSRSLVDQLLDQWRLVEAAEPVGRAGEYLISFIDDDGYLRTDRQTLLDQAPPDVDVDLLDEALGLIQSNLEPVGVAARDLRECLLLQIDAKMRQGTNGDAAAGDLSLERLLVSDYLKDIENNRLPRIAKETGRDIEQIKQAIAQLRRFHPHPGRLLVEDSPRTITPDAIIEYEEEEDRYVARLKNDRLPALRISRAAQRMSRDRGLDSRTRTFVKNNISSAQWLMEAVVRRHSTLLRVINVVIDAQRDYFDYGPQHLKPLPMTTVADQLGIDVSTVSRAVSEKYLQTPRGIVPLRMFFSGGTETQAGEAMSWTAVQAKLKEIIDGEDKSNPLSDDVLMDELKKHGIDIARRTVAKYRKQLNIPAARQRREY